MLWHASSSPWSPCSFQNKQTHFAFSGPFPCDICGRNFNDTGNRRRHIECTHGGKRKWMCFVCGKSVRERCDGIVFTVLSDRSLECCCPPPPFFFFSSSIGRTTLREHMRIHSGEKPHICALCGQGFRHKSSYRLVGGDPSSVSGFERGFFLFLFFWTGSTWECTAMTSATSVTNAGRPLYATIT